MRPCVDITYRGYYSLVVWLVLESKQAAKELDRAPREVQEAFEAWKNIVFNSGPEGVRRVNGYWDHALRGEWSGARASSLSKKWRVIYVVESNVLRVLVLKVTPHDYRR